MIEKGRKKRMERVTSAKRGNNRKRKGYRFSDRKRVKEIEVKSEIKGKKREREGE